MATYMELMGDLFDKSECLSDDASNEEVFAFLSDNRDLIRSIADDARGTGLFDKSREQYDEFRKTVLKDEQSVEQNVVNAYLWVLDRIVNSPTQLHMQSSVLLCMPIVDEAFADQQIVPSSF